MNFENFKNKYQKAPVDHYPHRVNNKIVVSVCVQTYNHELYIEECLDGILKQQTDFPIEILLGEDDSKDCTREICIEYAKKYPDKIRLFLHHRENNLQIDGQPTGRFNFLYNLSSASGKYIAFCEGDDYWTDPLKLQKQVEFMEENEDALLVGHQANIVENKRLTSIVFPEKQPKFLKVYKVILKGGGYFATNSIMVKTSVAKEVNSELFLQFPAGDTALNYFVIERGKIGFINEVMSNYRTNLHNSWTSNQKPGVRIRRLINVIKCNHEVFKQSKYKIFYLIKQIETMKRLSVSVLLWLFKK